MDKKLKNKYFNIFIDLANQWLHKDVGKKEYSYLKDRIHPQYIDFWKFGYFPSSYEKVITFIDDFGRLINDDPYDVLEEFGIIYKYYKKIRSFFYYNTLLIPMYNVYNEPITISGRTMEPETSQKLNNINKYKHLSYHRKNHLFGLNNSYKYIIENKSVVIVEGQIDCISGFNCGIKNIVALGGNKLSFEQIVLLKRFTTNFMMLLDNDEGGNSGYERAINQAKSYNFNLSKLKVPSEKDLNKYITTNNLNSIKIGDLL